MRVAGNDHVNSAGYRVQPQFMDIVQAESDDDVRPTDIAGVNDMRHPGQALLSLWT